MLKVRTAVTDRDAIAYAGHGGGRSTGAPLRFPLDPSHGFAGLRHQVGGLELAYADSGTRGDDPNDRMGLYLQAYDAAGRATGRPRPPSYHCGKITLLSCPPVISEYV